MYGLTTITRLTGRGGRTSRLAAVALAALNFLAATPAPTTAQVTSANTYRGVTVVHAGTIGLAPGQRVLVTVPGRLLMQDGSARPVRQTIKVYVCPTDPTPGSVNESTLVYSGEPGGLNESRHELGHLFTLSHGEIRVSGEPVPGRVQVWIEVESSLLSATQEGAEALVAALPSPIFELVDEANGKTVVYGLLLPAVQQVTAISAM